jgi:hypothetical protein
MTKNIDELIVYLTKIYSNDKFIKESAKGIDIWLKDKDNIPSNIKVEDIKVKYRSQNLCFSDNLLNKAYITTFYELYFNEKEIGYYKLISNIDGTPDDDYFVIYNEFR